VNQAGGWRISNLEQQGILPAYYQRICQNLDIRAWLPFIVEFSNRSYD
jgi:hypothetical protein